MPQGQMSDADDLVVGLFVYSCLSDTNVSKDFFLVLRWCSQ